ncbi:MAG: anaerobic ribonucleoside-triphosphate reductase activating protein [Campylobacterales bacterium]|nr:anaerobic ribonucleoside-triphosphate reductase activating protein [Campylobacterales bacterium]
MLHDITPFTLLDFPDTPAAIFWFAGCNLRCAYCYNPEIVLGEGCIDASEALAFLQRREGLLEGVVFSGGECTQVPSILTWARSVKALGFGLKIDTNAMRPDVLRRLLDEHLMDYCALDYKAPQALMQDICGGGSESRFWESFDLLRTSGVDFEVRTTFHGGLMRLETLEMMAHTLHVRGYRKPFYVQRFVNGVATLGNLGDDHTKAVPMAYVQWR